MKHKLGNLVFIVLVVLTVVVWLVFPPINDGREDFVRTYAGEVLGSVVIVLMSFSLFLSSRPKWAEPYFGGLDKMYMTHRHTSTSAFLLLFVHLLTVPITTINLRLGNYLAIVAFLGIVAIVLPTLAPRIPFLNNLTGKSYEGWKKLHRFIGIFFILGYIHALTIDALSAFIAINWVQIFFILGTVSYLYTEVFGRFFRKYVPYTVEAVNHPNNSVTEVVLRAKKEPIQKQRAGQFLFVRFGGDRELNESHPFTISSAPGEDVLRLTVKACGDFTRHLFATLKAGTDAIIEGAYGMFDYKTGGPRQIWVAGGIGVTPFLAFMRDLETDLAHDIDFYYTVRHREEAVFVDEIENIIKKHPRIKPYIRFSAVHGSLNVDEIIKNAEGGIRGQHVYMCGPLPMVQAFEKKFLEAGVPAGNIHFEEFNFR
ncbi:MAG: ferric reductase-like transmembrane domain-containing protein [Anaerolineales bacterium]|nr:MAG: ferric reductase-like transmembrane domain-containing protein [Anaerolineales bacterium]